MAESLGTAVLDLRADGAALKRDLASAEKETGGRLAGIQKRADKWGKNLTKTVTLPFLALTAGSLKLASDVDKGLREVNTLFGETGAAAEKNFQEMREEVADFSKELGISQKVAVKGLYQAISAGVPKDNVFDFMRTAGKAAIGGNTDVETSIDGITTYLNAFGLEASQAEAVADSMLQAVADGKTTFEEMSKAAFNVAPAAAAAGVSFQEVNAAVATLAKSGVPTSVATTQMRAALDGLQKPSEELDKIFQDLGYQNAQVAIESKGLGFALDAVKKASKGNNGTLQQLLGSTEAVAAANVLAGTGAKDFNKFLDNQRKSAGNVDKAFAEMEQSTARQMERLKVGLENLGISIGNILLPWLNKMVGVGQKVSDWLNGMSDGQRKAVVGVGMFAAALGPALIITGKFVGALRSAAKTLRLAAAAKWIAAKAQAAYNAVLNANPMMRIVTVLSLLAAGLVVAYQRSETFRAIVDKALEVVGNAASWLWGVIQSAWGGIVSATSSTWAAIKVAFDAIKGAFDTVGSTAKWLWQNVIVPAWSGIKTATSFLWNQVIKRYFDLWKRIIETVGATAKWLWSNAVKPAWDAITAGTSALWGAIQAFVGRVDRGFRVWGDRAMWVWDNAIKPAWAGITSGTRALWDNVIRPVAGFIGTAFENIGNAAIRVRNTIRDAFQWIRANVVGPAVNAFKRIGDGFIDVVNAIGSGASRISKWVSRLPVLNIAFNYTPIPHLAEGDIVRGPQVSLIGEDGPEAVIPLGRKRRKRGLEMMTRAAQVMGVAGVDPAAGLPHLANGAFVGVTAQDMRDRISATARGDGGPGFGKVFDFLKQGLGAFVGALPGINLPSGEWADVFKGFVKHLLGKAKELGTSLFSFLESEFGGVHIIGAKENSEKIMGRPYIWGGGRPPSWMHRGYDCSGSASTAWWTASNGLGTSGTTMSLHPISKPASGNEPFLFGFRGMQNSDPRAQHMGWKILGDWYQFGDPGRKGGGDSQWTDLRVPPGVPGFAEGTDRITREGLAYLHRDEEVVPASERRRKQTLFDKLAENVHFHEPSDADRILGDLGNRFAVRAGAM